MIANKTINAKNKLSDCIATDVIKMCIRDRSYTEMEKMGIMLPLTETAAKYYYGLKYEDEVLVTCKMTKLTVARCEFTYEVYKLPEKKLMTVGKTGHGFVNREFVPVNLKKLYPEIWNKMHDLLED